MKIGNQSSRAVDAEFIRAAAKYLDGFEKLSGSQEAHQMVDWVEATLDKWGIAWTEYQFDAYLSNPISSSLNIVGTGEEISCRPRSFGASCEVGIEGQLYFVEGIETIKKFNIDGKIAICYGFDEELAKRIELSGAIGVIQIWEGEESHLHEDTVGSIWGTPIPDQLPLLMRIPVVCITRKSGEAMLAEMSDRPVHVELKTKNDEAIMSVRLPVAEIKGKSEAFVLISGHYDTWYRGVVDNGSGNIACLECARVLQSHQAELERGVKIAFWPGHSNGRYMGSTWYCDHQFMELYKNGIAHLNVDCIGALGAGEVVFRSTGLEGEPYLRAVVNRALGDVPFKVLPIYRGGDYGSFWGVNLPYTIVMRHECSKVTGTFKCPGSGNTTWHTLYDRIDQLDFETLEQDIALLIETAFGLTVSESLPALFEPYFQRIIDTFESVISSHCKIDELIGKVIKLKCAVEERMSQMEETEKNRLIKVVGGELNRLSHSYSGRFEQDLVYPHGFMPFIGDYGELKKSVSNKSELLFLDTALIRQINRWSVSLDQLIELVQN